jgi:hypothetical protein
MNLFSLFKKKQKRIYGMYTILIPNPTGFSTQSASFNILNLNGETFYSEMHDRIKSYHKVDNFTIIMMCFYPPNPQDHPGPSGPRVHPVVGQTSDTEQGQ